MKRIKAVIFDCDGVMFDSRRANVKYYNHILHHFGRPPMTEAHENFVHMHTAEASVKHIFEGTRLEDQAQAFRAKQKYHPFIKHMIIEPGLKNLLKELKPEYKLAVATNRSDTIGEVLASHSLTTFFDRVVSALEVKNPKPHPESIHNILDFFHIRPTEAVYVGDSEVDQQTAEASGIILIAFQNNCLDTPWHINRLSELVRILEQLNSKDTDV